MGLSFFGRFLYWPVSRCALADCFYTGQSPDLQNPEKMVTPGGWGLAVGAGLPPEVGSWWGSCRQRWCVPTSPNPTGKPRRLAWPLGWASRSSEKSKHWSWNVGEWQELVWLWTVPKVEWRWLLPGSTGRRLQCPRRPVCSAVMWPILGKFFLCCGVLRAGLPLQRPQPGGEVARPGLKVTPRLCLWLTAHRPTDPTHLRWLRYGGHRGGISAAHSSLPLWCWWWLVPRPLGRCGRLSVRVAPPAAKNPRLRASCAVVAKKVQSATAPAVAGRQREWKPQAAEQENSEDGWWVCAVGIVWDRGEWATGMRPGLGFKECLAWAVQGLEHRCSVRVVACPCCRLLPAIGNIHLPRDVFISCASRTQV